MRKFIFKYFFILFLLFSSSLFADDETINISTFPRPIMSAGLVSEKIIIDGFVNEPDWARADSITDFYQTQPVPGLRGTERTVVRVLYDAEFLYVSAVLYDSDPSGIIIQSLEQDFESQDNDCFAIMLDTFNDNKSGYGFLFNAAGAIKDMYINNDGSSINSAWEGIVNRKTSIQDHGWEIELAFPLTSLRFNPNEGSQDWGINFLRRIRRKGEDIYWSPIEPYEKLLVVSKGGTLKGLENIKPGRNLQLKPFVIGNQLNVDESSNNSDAGLDFKFSVTPSLTLDMTYNTDFSQVDSDDERVNLTRFPLFFPEKRDFFLENAGIFEFGDISNYTYRMKPERWSRSFTMFHSRRIGLESGSQIPILGGGRLSGKVGNFDVGYLNMTSEAMGDVPLMRFNVARVRRNIFQKSNIGAIFIDRNSDGQSRKHQSTGIDLNLKIDKLLIYSYVAQTDNPDMKNDNLAGRIVMAWRNNEWDLAAYYKKVEENFDPQVGFIQRKNVNETFATVGRHKRFSTGRFRNINPYVQVNQYDNLGGYMEYRALKAGFDVLFANRAMLFTGLTQTEEEIKTAFTLYGAEVPNGNYKYTNLSAYYRGDNTRLITLNGNFNIGKYFHGERSSYGISAEIKRGYRFSVDFGLNKNYIKFPDAEVNADVYNLKIKYNHSVNLLSKLNFQYNKAEEKLVTNFRVNLIHAPLSDLFLVYSNISDLAGDEKDTGMIALKFTKLFSL